MSRSANTCPAKSARNLRCLNLLEHEDDALRDDDEEFAQGESGVLIRSGVDRESPAGFRVLTHEEEHGRPGAHFEISFRLEKEGS